MVEFEMVHGKGTAADEEFTGAELAKWVELGRDSRQQAAAVAGMPDTDDEQSVEQLVAWNLVEQTVPEKGDCCFEAICVASIQHEGRQQDLREAVVDSMRAAGKVSSEYAAQMRQPGRWATDKEFQEAASLLAVEILVVLMRPVGDAQRIQRFMPARSAGSERIVLVFRPGHFNAAVESAADEKRMKMTAAAGMARALEEAENRCSGMEGQLRLPVEGLPKEGSVAADVRKAAAIDLRKALEASEVRCGGRVLSVRKVAVQNFRECIKELKATLRRVRAKLEHTGGKPWIVGHCGWKVEMAQKSGNAVVLDFVPADGGESERAAAAVWQQRTTDRVERR